MFQLIGFTMLWDRTVHRLACDLSLHWRNDTTVKWQKIHELQSGFQCLEFKIFKLEKWEGES